MSGGDRQPQKQPRHCTNITIVQVHCCVDIHMPASRLKSCDAHVQGRQQPQLCRQGALSARGHVESRALAIITRDGILASWIRTGTMSAATKGADVLVTGLNLAARDTIRAGAVLP